MILIRKIGYECLSEYSGEFFSLEVDYILPNGKCWCYVSDGKYHEYIMNQLKLLVETI